MKKFLAIFILLYCGCKKENAINNLHAPDQSNQAVIDTSWKLVWSDEFDYSGLPDSTKWNYEKGFIRNGEPQYYESKNKKNSKVNNGILKLTALYDNTKVHPITSASIITKNRMNFLYGRVEVRAKMPTGSGAFPAIWMLGINRDTIGWPRCGEIDIMEWLGQYPQYILGSIHTIATNGSDTAQITPYVPRDSATLSTKYHVYAIEWDSTQIKYFYDKINYATYTSANLTAEEWKPFTKPMYLLLNLAMGASGGDIDYTKFPFIYQVDYVRYYIKK